MGTNFLNFFARYKVVLVILIIGEPLVDFWKEIKENYESVKT